MYNTTDSYKSKIYNVNHFLKVYINDAEIESKYILDCRPSSTLFTNGEIELGSTPSQTVELKLYKSVIPDTINKVEIKSGITGEIVPIGIYNVDKAPTSDDYTVTLSLADNMIKFEFNYDGSKLVNDNDGKVKIIRVLQDICSKANVELGSTSFLNMNKVIAVYDNAVSARTYLSYIAEQAGGFAFIGRDGKLYIKSFKYALGQKIGEGKSIVIENTNNLKAKTVIKGEHSQKTTEGRNVFKIKDYTKLITGLNQDATIVKTSDSITVNTANKLHSGFYMNKTRMAEYTKDADTTKKYVISADIEISDDCLFRFGWEQNNTYQQVQKGKFRAKCNANTMTQSFVCYTNYAEVTIKVTNLMVSLSEDSAFEEFTDGRSPNTNYQQEIETVGSNVNILPDKEQWEQGTINNNTGENISSTTRLRNIGYIGVEPKTNYFASVQNNKYCFTNIILYDNKGSYIKDYYSVNNAINGAKALLIAIPENCYNIKAVLRNADNTSNIIVDEYPRIKAKFEKGDIQTPYSIYSQGSVEIIKRNRNQLSLPEQTGISNGVSRHFKDGTVTLQGTLTNTWCTAYNKEDFLLKAGTYTCSASNLDKEFEVRMYLKSGGTKSFWLNRSVKKVTVTFDRDIIGCFMVYHHATKGDEVDISIKIQLEAGEKCSDFIMPKQEKFIVPIQREMLKGDCIDTEEHHKWQKLILNGTENVFRIKGNNNKYIFGIETEMKAISTASDEVKEIYCNVATQNSRGFLYSNITADWISYGSDNNYYRDIVLSCMNTYNMTVEEFKAWLKEKYDSGNPVIIYYQLKTPIELELTDEQKKVLKEIQNMDLYEDYTIIESDAEMQVNFARAEIPFRYFQNFEWGAKYKLSKIRYEDGIRVFEKGDDTENTLYINPDNMFIVDQDQIDNIYDELKDLELYSFKGDSIVDLALDIGDIVVIDGKQVLYCGSSQYSGRWKASINSEIKSRERQETTTVKKPSQKTINRRVQSSIDQVNGEIKQLIEAKDETSETLSKHEQTLNGFTNTVSKIEKDVESVKSTANSSVKKVEVKYALGNSSTEAPTTGWSTTAPTWEAGKYMWQKTVTTFVDGSVSEASPTCIQGAKGADGVDGKDGKDGVNGEKGDTGASGKDGQTYYTWVKYADSPTTGMSDDPVGKTYIGFAYNKTTSVESTNYSDYSWSLIKGEKGDTGDKGEAGKSGTDGNGIKKIDYYYATTTTQTAPTASNITSTSIPKLSETNKYLWQKEVITFTTTSIPQITVLLLAVYGDKGATGEQGETGATGKGIKSVQDQYYLSTSNVKQTGGAWKNTQDEWEEGKYIWTRSFITWTDNTTSYTTPCLADSINKANQVASDTAKNLENNYSSTKETETMIKQESESIRLEVETIEKFTRDISSHRELHLVDTADYAENLVLTLKIYGDTEEWKELAPSTSLAPGLTVAPLGTTIDLIVDSQSRLNPSEDKQVFTINYGKKLRNLGNVRDELDIINNKVTIIRRIGLNDSGQEYVLEEEQTEELGELKLPTLKADTYIYVREYPNLEYFCRYITDNEYIKKFATQEGLQQATVELNTKIEQSNKEIILLARQKVGKDEIIASINISPEEIKILAEKLQISAENVLNILAGNTINLTSRNLIIASKYLNIDEDGNLILDSPGINVFRVKNSRNSSRSIYINDQYIGVNTDGEENCITIGPINNNEGEIELSGNGRSILRASGLTTPTVTQTSTESTKKNFEILKKATDIVKNGDIYGYNLKIENDTDKKHYGFVIADEGGNFKTPEEVISKTGKGIDTYSMISVLWKACQELIIKVEQLENNMK